MVAIWVRRANLSRTLRCVSAAMPLVSVRSSRSSWRPPSWLNFFCSAVASTRATRASVKVCTSASWLRAVRSGLAHSRRAVAVASTRCTHTSSTSFSLYVASVSVYVHAPSASRAPRTRWSAAAASSSSALPTICRNSAEVSCMSWRHPRTRSRSADPGKASARSSRSRLSLRTYSALTSALLKAVATAAATPGAAKEAEASPPPPPPAPPPAPPMVASSGAAERSLAAAPLSPAASASRNSFARRLLTWLSPAHAHCTDPVDVVRLAHVIKM
mmetsp:Transcript_31140/g.101492  ORF Transcript_31140/g.101492 Transcript_31140/m.101492 type:complete len:273 (+) Transcript_31140:231-1049(+)